MFKKKKIVVKLLKIKQLMISSEIKKAKDFHFHNDKRSFSFYFILRFQENQREIKKVKSMRERKKVKLIH